MHYLKAWVAHAYSDSFSFRMKKKQASFMCLSTSIVWGNDKTLHKHSVFSVVKKAKRYFIVIKKHERHVDRKG